MALSLSGYASLPTEVVEIAFRFLSAIDLARAGAACRAWRQVARSSPLWRMWDLPTRFPGLSIITQEDTQALFNFDTLKWSYPSRPSDSQRNQLIATCQKLYQARMSQKHTFPLPPPNQPFLKLCVFDIPTHQDGTPLLFGELTTLADHLNREAVLPPRFSPLPQIVTDHFRNTPLPPGLCLMALKPLPGTVNRSRHSHRRMVHSYGTSPLPPLGPFAFGLFLVNNILPSPRYTTLYVRVAEQTTRWPNPAHDTIIGYHTRNGLICGEWLGKGKNLGTTLCLPIGPLA